MSKDVYGFPPVDITGTFRPARQKMMERTQFRRAPSPDRGRTCRRQRSRLYRAARWLRL